MNKFVQTSIVAMAGAVALTTGGALAAQAIADDPADPAKRDENSIGVVSTVETDPTPDPTADPTADPTQNTINTRVSKVTSAPGAGTAEPVSVNTVKTAPSVKSKVSVVSKPSKVTAPSRKTVVSQPSKVTAPSAKTAPTANTAPSVNTADRA